MFPCEAFNFIMTLKLIGNKAGFQGWGNSGRPCYPPLSFIRTEFCLENTATPILAKSRWLVCGELMLLCG